MRTLVYVVAVALLMTLPAVAQRGGDSGGDRGSRGGFPGGGFPGGEDRGSRGGPGGGFPGGGFPGGGFPGGGDRGSRGGPGGGFPGGGFPGGGDRGSRGGGGPGGGFNPADMIRRFDRNNNNMIDPEESQGPAQFFLQRLAQSNPKIDLSKPVPIDLLSGEIDKMRGGSGGGDSDSESDGPQLLVPDFSLSLPPAPIAGFAAEGSMFSIKVEERDMKEAQERMRRYDRDRDGVLTAAELGGGRWGDDPMQFDRNRDGKISVSELSVRYANRRVEDEERKASANDNNNRARGGWMAAGAGGWTQGDRGDDEKKEEESRFGDAKSYRMALPDEKLNSIKGLPDFFARSDADGDGQVMMSEFSTSWSAETLQEYLKWDLNSDGIITARECLAALEGGARVSGTTSSSSSSSESDSKSAGGSGGGEKPSDEIVAWAKRQIERYDTNRDNQLTASEWEAMRVKPDGADTNGDGIITVDEYATFRSK